MRTEQEIYERYRKLMKELELIKWILHGSDNPIRRGAGRPKIIKE